MRLFANQPLITVECCSCHTLFAMTEELYDRRKEDHRSFWCPQGHSQHFTGQTKEEKEIARLKGALSTADSNHAYWQRRAETAIECGQTKKRKLANARGQITKLKNKYEPEDVSEE